MSQTTAQLISGTATQDLALSKATLGAGTVGAPSLTTNGDTDTGIFFPAANTVAFSGNGTEVARFDSSGRLLVGASTARGVGSSYSFPIQNENTTAAGITFVTNSNDAESSYLVLGKSRGASVGSNTIVQVNDVIGRISFAGADGTDLETRAATIEAQVDGTPGANDMPGRLVFSTTADGASSPTERMRISSAGRVEIGSAVGTNTGILNVRTSATNEPVFNSYATNASFNNDVAIFSADRNTTNNSYNFLQCVRQGFAVALIVRDSGNVQNANNSYTAISDVKLKENIVDARSQWNDIKSLRVRNYNFKEETGQSTHKQIGLIAQEVETVCPGLVDESLDRDFKGKQLNTTTKGVNYSVLYMKSVKALQEAMIRIEILEAEVAVLKAS